ncbi:MAG: Hsp70 family protein [Pseudomonadota bacterium]|nr:Hsp70 family protein [Pseudomonadota bacterium]
MSITAFGIDLGTTNTVVVKSTSDGALDALPLGDGKDARRTHPSVIAFEPTYDRGRMELAMETGAKAISLAAAYPEDFRYVQSFKSHVASAAFAGTTIFGKRFDLAGIFGCFLRRSGIADAINAVDGPKRIVVGRPVVFYGDKPDEDLALSRYRDGFKAAGIEDFDFVLEPIGGAFSFFRTVRSNVTVLIADFGGGTSDFVVVRFRLTGSRVKTEVLSHAGIGIAGDTFDARIIENALVRHFGADSHYRENGKRLPVPRSYYSALARWHQMTLLRAPKFLRELEIIQRASEAPEQIARLIYAIDHNQGLAISRAVSGAKAELSDRDSADLTLDLGELQVRETITRADFESWIADDVARIAERVDETLIRSGLSDGAIDKVFLTGGTSFVPAINALFTDRFGTDKVSAGERFSSVAEGLSLVGHEDDIAYWATA